MTRERGWKEGRERSIVIYFYTNKALSFWLFLNKVVLLQVELKNGVLDCREDETNVFRVRCAREVRVDRLLGVRVQLCEHLEDKLPSGDRISVRPWKQRKRKGTG